jgi:hypothetical protein
MAPLLTDKTTAMEKGKSEHPRDGKIQFRSPHEAACCRCGGLMVGECCIDLLNSASELEFVAKRCVQCGDIVDPVILRNRYRQQLAQPIQSSQTSANSSESMEALC